MATVISDSSPLVHLSAIGRFELLKNLYPDLLIPVAVWEEVTVAGVGRPGASDLEHAVKNGWIRLHTANPMTTARIELKDLDQGEAEALALALDLKAEVVLLDEVRGRSVARQLGLRAVGTLGVLIEGKRRGFVSTLREEMDRIRTQSQMQLSPEIEQLALRMAGE